MENEMKPTTRTKNLIKILGWQGGTIHDACKEIGVEVNDFLYGEIDFGKDQCTPCLDFKRGYFDASDIALYLSSNKGNFQYWLGVVACANNDFKKVEVNHD